MTAVNWDTEHEEEAKGIYRVEMSSSHFGFEISLAGLMLYPHLAVKDGKPEDLVGKKTLLFDNSSLWST